MSSVFVADPLPAIIKDSKLDGKSALGFLCIARYASTTPVGNGALGIILNPNFVNTAYLGGAFLTGELLLVADTPELAPFAKPASGWPTTHCVNFDQIGNDDFTNLINKQKTLAKHWIVRLFAVPFPLSPLIVSNRISMMPSPMFVRPCSIPFISKNGRST